MSYRVFTVSTSTWKDVVEIKPSKAPWGRLLGEGKGFSSDFVLSDDGVAATVGKLTPIERALIIDFKGVIMYCGLITDDDYAQDTELLNVDHTDLMWMVMEYRLIAQDRTSTMPAWKQTYSGLEYDTIVKRIVQLATTGAGRTIPMVYEDDYTGGRSRTYNGYNADSALDAIEEIMELENGPDVDFRPRWNAARDGVEFILRTGFMNPDDNMIEIDFSADQSPGKSLKRKRSGQERATQVIGIGEGSGVDMKVRVAGGTGAFALERAEQAKNIKDGTQLSEFAQGEMSMRGNLITQYSCDIDMSSPAIKTFWDLQPGTVLRWQITGDRAISDGWRESEIIEISGDLESDFVHIEMQ